MENYNKNGHSKKIPNKKKPVATGLFKRCYSWIIIIVVGMAEETAKPMSKLNLFYTNNDLKRHGEEMIDDDNIIIVHILVSMFVGTSTSIHCSLD
jgi:hypothetical protein